MIRRTFLIGAASVMLAGCGKDLLGPPEAGPIYSVRPVFPPAASVADTAKVPWSLSIMRPNVPGGLASDRIALIQPGGVLDFYAKATYPDTTSTMIQQALLDGFEASGRIGAVSREQDALQADYLLVVEVKNFEAQYAVADGIPQVVVAMTAKLTTARGRKIMGTFTTTQTGTASVNSTPAVAQALTAALGAAVKQVVDWTLAAPPPPQAAPLGQQQDWPQGSPAKPAGQVLKDIRRGSDSLR
ncbi:MAG TPA: ABC-type transport auxiliary lipoprotein family protein [Rhizomicrobium sp.]|nr:ABC-type transport auxiliary lipoprotein family protein [Rhizomicrobium sp.]